MYHSKDSLIIIHSELPPLDQHISFYFNFIVDISFTYNNLSLLI